MTKITGRLIMEQTSKTFADGRVGVLVVGIIAMSPEDAKAYCAPRPTQQHVAGSAAAGLLRLTICEGEASEPRDPEHDAEDHKGMMRYYRSATVDQLLTSPIWRV